MPTNALKEARGALREFKKNDFSLITIDIYDGTETSNGQDFKDREPSASYQTYCHVQAAGSVLSVLNVNDMADMVATTPGVDTAGTAIWPLPKAEDQVTLWGEAFSVARVDPGIVLNNVAIVFDMTLTRRNIGAHSRQGSRTARAVFRP